MLAIALKKAQGNYTCLVFCLVYLIIALWLVPGYFRWDSNVYLGLGLAPYICTLNKEQLSLRYTLPAFLSIGLAILLPVNTLLFIAMLFAALLFIECSIGKVNSAFVFLILLISPIFGHFTHLFEFPVRLWLTQVVSQVLSLAGTTAIAAGNQIQLSKYQFSVDPACAGLNMLVTSLIICLFTLCFYQRKLKRQLGLWHIALVFTITIALNVACNFFRILLLVFFKIMPGTFFHDAVGIGCLLLYVIVPLTTVTSPFIKRFGHVKLQREAAHISENTEVKYLWLHTIFLMAIVITSFRLVKADSLITSPPPVNLAGYKKTCLDGGIIKFENKEALIYVKPTLFFAPEHDPMICWRGSGYRLENVKAEQISGHNIYTATLQKGPYKIFAAWWFDNGKTQTINQLTWRCKAAHGDGSFYLINVNAATAQSLNNKVTALFAKPFKF
ncbi:exosortase N [Mucilaginibacter gracilis]|uniref:Exosortase N n=1 Tax=Mucilaginibacter gracilis TaxID=423350 RepID=A0A495J253_9SPHI|nr:exosortase N [Mucilaginibacter gracilis]RKR82428.1 exosortase N [Mucilaginibacter gracilis]